MRSMKRISYIKSNLHCLKKNFFFLYYNYNRVTTSINNNNYNIMPTSPMWSTHYNILIISI